MVEHWTENPGVGGSIPPLSTPGMPVEPVETWGHGLSLLVSLLVLTATIAPAGAGSWETVLFRHDFNTSVNGSPDADVWLVNHPGHWWWTQGRTHFPEPSTPGLPSPRVEDGICVIEHHHYNPWDLGNPNEWFLGGEIRTVDAFAPNRAYRFEARVRSQPFQNGLVSSFFLYGYDGANSDEVDFEFVSKWTNDDEVWPDGDPVLTNTWNESAQKPLVVVPEALDLSEWNTFRIYWYPSAHRIDWAWLDPVNGETLLRTETDSAFVPDEPMAIYFNFWAPCYTSWGHGCDAWDAAADSSLQPVNAEGQNVIFSYEIDYIEAIATLGDVSGDGIVNGLDVSPFVHILTSGLYDVSADMNGDGAVNGLDVDSFVAAVLDVGTQTVPEPSALILATGALLVLFCRRCKAC